MEVTDKVIVVTGGAGGIGSSLCRRFVAEGAKRVIVSDLDPRVTEVAAAELGGTAIPCDVSSESQVQSLVRRTIEEFGQIDLFVSNAGITVKGGIEAANDEWGNLWNVNVMAHVYAARAVLPGMLERGDGYLLQVSSAAGILTEVGSAAYSVTKGAAVSLAEWLSVHYQKRGIKVSCLCPAGVATDFLDMDDPIHQFLHMTSVTPEHVADCVIEGLRAEKFLILTHAEVQEFFEFKTRDYDKWLKNFARVHQKLTRRSGKGDKST